jgi:hypothetical protein
MLALDAGGDSRSEPALAVAFQELALVRAQPAVRRLPDEPFLDAQELATRWLSAHSPVSRQQVARIVEKSK